MKIQSEINDTIREKCLKSAEPHVFLLAYETSESRWDKLMTKIRMNFRMMMRLKMNL